MRAIVIRLLVLALVLVPGLVRAEDGPTTGDALEKPSVAWRAVNAIDRRMAYQLRQKAMQDMAATYLAAFEKHGGMALGSEALNLGYLQRTAQQWTAARGSFRSVWRNADMEEGLRDQGAMNEARLLGTKDLRTALGDEVTAATIEALLGYAAGMAGPSRLAVRSTTELALASVLDALERKQPAHDLRIAVVKRDPTQTARVYRTVLRGLMGTTHSMDGYDTLRAEVKPLLELFVAQQKKAAAIAEAKRAEALEALKASSPDSIGEDGVLKPKPPNTMSVLERVAYNAQRQASSATSLIERIWGADKPFAMLGSPVPEWTLEHAFGDTRAMADLRGKVVVMDFWATWCHWCIRSFPAIRDLLRDYGDKGLVVVGVTASSSSVYAARYDLDEDLKDKATPGARTVAAARIARGSQAPDGITTFTPEDYVAKERAVLAEFIENHKMTWPVVMIDKAEPAPKYALTGWPHAVVIDRQGRVRYFKSGALLRDRPEAVQAFRKVLDDLLAEPGTSASR